jgi:hypothetical protein
MCDYWRGFEWWMDLLTTYTHDSEIQEITAPQLIITAHINLFLAWCVFTSHCLSEASNSGDSSASCSQVHPSQIPAQNSASTGWIKVKVKVKVTLRLAVYRQSVFLGAKPLETRPEFCFKPLPSKSLCNILSDERLGLSLMNMIGLSSSVYIAHKACCCKFFPLHYLRLLSVQASESRSWQSYASYAATTA